MVDLDTYLLFNLSNQEIRSRVISKVIEDELVTKLQKDLFRFFLSNRDSGDLSISEVLAYLSSIGYEHEVVDGLNKVLFDFTVTMDKERQLKIIDKFKEFIKKTRFYNVISEINQNGLTNIDDVISKVNAISSLDLSGYSILDYSDKDTVLSIYAEHSREHSIMKSSFNVINNCLAVGGYSTGDLTLVTAAPGRGKTFLMINESLGFMLNKVPTLNIYLGDMTEYLVLVRYLCRVSGADFSYLLNKENFFRVYEEYSEIFKYLRVVCLPSLTWDTDELFLNLLQLRDSFPYKAFVIDYDLNVRKSGNDMYTEGGYLYAKMSALTKSSSMIGFMITQPKIQYWNEEIIPAGGASESSRKEHAVDNMISFGRLRPDVPYGVIAMSKVRQGVLLSSPVYLDLGKSLIKEISLEDYEKGLASYNVKRVQQSQKKY